MEIRYVPFGIANNFGEYIEVNENLKKYPKLHDAILRHELSHTNIPGFTLKDFMLDMSAPQKISNKQLISFMIHHPRAMKQFLPIYKQEGTIFYDINMLIVWGFGLTAIGIVVFLTM